MLYKSVRIREFKQLSIYYDLDPMSPREWSNVGTVAVFHKNRCFGDTVTFKSEDFAGWDKMKDYIVKEFKAKIILPIYLYEHSIVAISTTPFSCKWDSRQVGFIYATASNIREAYGKRITEKVLNKVRKALLQEIEILDEYVKGNIFSYVLHKAKPNLESVPVDPTSYPTDPIDSCTGFYGTNFRTNGLLHQTGIDDKDLLDEL